MSKRTAFWLVLIVLIIAAFFRLFQLQTLPPGLYPDEAMNGNNAAEALRTGDYKVYYPENNGREGLFINIQALVLKFFGAHEPWVLRLTSAIFGILTVLGLYLLGREIFSRKAGLMASFFLATSFWHINFSRIGFRAISAPFFLVWALAFLLIALRRASEEDGTHNPQLGTRKEGYKLRAASYAILGGISFGLGFHTYIAYRVAPLLLLFFIPFFKDRRNFWRIVLLFIIATFLVALPIGWYYLFHTQDFLGRTSQISVFSSADPILGLLRNTAKTVGMFFAAGDYNWRHNYPGSPELFWPVALLLVAGSALGLRSLFRRESDPETAAPHRFAFLLAFAWLILAFAPVVISDEGLPHALRSIMMLPPLMLLAGYGAAILWDWVRSESPALGVILGLTTAALLVVNAYISYFVLWGENPNVQGAFAADQVEISRRINALPDEVPKYVVVDAGGVLVRGIPMPAQTVMFITGTFLPEDRRAKNVRYLLPGQTSQIPAGAATFHIR